MSGVNGGGRARQRRVHAGVMAGTLAGITMLAAACGTSTPAGAGTGSGKTPYQQALAYAQCMRAHGDPGFPDPNGQGLFPHPAGSQYQSASNACGHLLPSERLTGAQKEAHIEQALKFSACMRSHGVPDFPDPAVVQGGNAVAMGPPRGTDTNSPRFQAAVHACRAIEPALAGQLAGG